MFNTLVYNQCALHVQHSRPIALQGECYTGHCVNTNVFLIATISFCSQVLSCLHLTLLHLSVVGVSVSLVISKHAVLDDNIHCAQQYVICGFGPHVPFSK